MLGAVTRPACANPSASCCLWDCCVPFLAPDQTTELSSLLFFFPFKVSPVVRERGERGQAKWNENHESLIDHGEVLLKGCQGRNISYGEEDHRAGREWKEAWNMRTEVSCSLPCNWFILQLTLSQASGAGRRTQLCSWPPAACGSLGYIFQSFVLFVM